MANIVKVDFYGDTIEVVRNETGDWASIPRLSRYLGTNEQAQFRRLQGEPWARVAKIATRDSRGQMQETWHIHIADVAMWFATMSVKKVAPSVRPKLARYQTECARVLHEAVFGKPAAAPDPRKLDGAGDLRDNRALAGECKQMIGRCALVEGKTFQKIHGELRKDFAIVSYLRARLSFYTLIREWLVKRMATAPVCAALRAAARRPQLALFPDEPSVH